jgi:hypothetical protein
VKTAVRKDMKINREINSLLGSPGKNSCKLSCVDSREEGYEDPPWGVAAYLVALVRTAVS